MNIRPTRNLALDTHANTAAQLTAARHAAAASAIPWTSILRNTEVPVAASDAKVAAKITFVERKKNDKMLHTGLPNGSTRDQLTHHG